MATPIPLQLGALERTSPRKATFVILAVSLAALLLLVGVIYGHGRATDAPAWFVAARAQRHLNGDERGLPRARVPRHPAARRGHALAADPGRRSPPRRSFSSRTSSTTRCTATRTSAAQGLVRPLYFFVLISHVGLSAVALPLVFMSLFLSLSGRFPRHKKIARYTLPHLALRVRDGRAGLRPAAPVRLTATEIPSARWPTKT